MINLPTHFDYFASTLSLLITLYIPFFFRLTQNFKLQYEILQNYSTLITNLEIDDRELNLILDTAKVYASQQQPNILQTSFIKFASNLMSHDPTTIIVKIMHLDNNLINDIMKNINYYNACATNTEEMIDMINNKI